MTDKPIVFEQPLNERIRGFLRLEFLFQQAEFRINGESQWDSRAAMEAILDIIALVGRADLRTELIKELERQAGIIETLSNKPGVDPERLEEVLQRIRPAIASLRSSEGSPGFLLKSNELLSCVTQRNSIPAGTCSFDIPGYQYWLDQPIEMRRQQLSSWLQEFNLFKDPIMLCLELLRGSAYSSSEIAQAGFFQRTLEGDTSCQMIRVLYPAEVNCFPEISGGRHRFTIRFLQQESPGVRPVQTHQDISFELQCCMI